MALLRSSADSHVAARGDHMVDAARQRPLTDDRNAGNNEQELSSEGEKNVICSH